MWAFPQLKPAAVIAIYFVSCTTGAQAGYSEKWVRTSFCTGFIRFCGVVNSQSNSTFWSPWIMHFISTVLCIPIAHIFFTQCLTNILCKTNKIELSKLLFLKSIRGLDTVSKTYQYGVGTTLHRILACFIRCTTSSLRSFNEILHDVTTSSS